MNYIYDIVLNFHKHYYNFFEWKRSDKLKNIIKIPTYRVSNKNILILKNNKVRITNSFLNKIKLDNKKYKKNICLVSNTKLSVGLLFDDEGNLLKRSSLIFEEEDEVNNFCKNLPLTKINYIENIEIPTQEKLRIEIEKKEILINYIKNNTNITTLKYLYYEYYKKECKKETQIKESLIKELNKNWTKKQNNLYQLIKILNKNNSLTK